MQCCGSGMIYSGSGSSHEISEFQIRIQHILFKHKAYLEITKQHTINSIKKKYLPTICHFLFHTIVLQYIQSRIHRPKIRNTFFICIFVFCCIRIRYNNSGSGSTTLLKCRQSTQNKKQYSVSSRLRKLRYNKRPRYSINFSKMELSWRFSPF